MAFKFNPFTGSLDVVNELQFNIKFKQIFSSLSAYDKIVDISYLDSGTKSERIGSVEFSSALYPDANMTKTVFWLGVGTMNQRIDKEEYEATVFGAYKIRKVFNYVSEGIRFRFINFELELF